jgi:hypothetical protein
MANTERPSAIVMRVSAMSKFLANGRLLLPAGI